MNKNEKPVARSLHNQQVRTAHRRRVPDQTPSRFHFIQNANDLRSYARLELIFIPMSGPQAHVNSLTGL
jgi:hypothetical protein